MINITRLDERAIDLNLNDIFFSIQGEGKYIGLPTLFFRFNKCNINPKCEYCDTEFDKCTINNLYEMRKIVQNYLKNYLIQCLCFTGGEPLLFIDQIRMILFTINSMTIGKDFMIKIETNGLLKLHEILPPYTNLVYTVTPKLDYIEDYAENIEYIKNSNNEINLKFMIDTDESKLDHQLLLVKMFLEGYKISNCDVYFSPINKGNEPKSVIDSYKKVFKLIVKRFNHPLFETYFMRNFKGVTIQINKLMEWK